MALSTAVTGFVLALPVVSSGSDEPVPSIALDSSANSASSGSAAPRAGDGSSPVVMGRDGLPAPSQTAAPEAALVEPPAGTDTIQAEVEVTGESPSSGAATEIAESPSTGPSGSASPASVDAPAPASAAAAAAAAAPDLESEVLALANQARERAGCPPLVADAGLAAVARAHSADMRDRNFFDHENPEGLDPVDLAEAAGQTSARAADIAHGHATPPAVVGDWLDSRDILLDCDLESLGVGVAQGQGGPWWTLVLGD